MCGNGRRGVYNNKPVDKEADGAEVAVVDSDRVFRGGGWLHDAGRCRAAFRTGLKPDDRYGDLGFRLARVPVEVSGK
jgi:formylglycine-generating enzyme required for sulfatase activity